MFLLNSLYRGDSNKNTKHSIINFKKQSLIIPIISAAMGVIPRDSRTVQNSRGKRAISVRATVVLLYIVEL